MSIMKSEDIIPCLNECLKFMYENRNHLPKVLPQHIIQHFDNIGKKDLSLTESISLLSTLQTHSVVSEHHGEYSLTKPGMLLFISGGFKSKP